MSYDWCSATNLNALSDAITDREYLVSTTGSQAVVGPDATAYNVHRVAAGANASTAVEALVGRVVALATTYTWYDPAADYSGLPAVADPTLGDLEALALSGRAGITHKFVKEFATLATSPGTWADGAAWADGDYARCRADGVTYLRASGAWTVPGSAHVPDLVTTYGWAALLTGEVIGKWLFDDMAAVLNVMKRRAHSWTVSGGGYEPSPASYFNRAAGHGGSIAAALAAAQANWVPGPHGFPYVGSDEVPAHALASGGFGSFDVVLERSPTTWKPTRGKWMSRTVDFYNLCAAFGGFVALDFFGDAAADGTLVKWDTVTAGAGADSASSFPNDTAPVPDNPVSDNRYKIVGVVAMITVDFPTVTI